MPPTGSNKTTVGHQVNPGGTHSIGVTIDGVFVPFVTIEGYYVDALVDAGHSPEAKEAAGSSEGDEG